MRSRAIFSLAVAAISGAAGAGQPFTLLTDQRSVSAFAAVYPVYPDGSTAVIEEWDDDAPETPFAEFLGGGWAQIDIGEGDTSFGIAGIESSALADGFSAAGLAMARVTVGSTIPGTRADSSGFSRNSIVFQIDEPQLIEICAVIEASVPADAPGNSAAAEIVFNRFDGINATTHYGYTSSQVEAVPYYDRLRLEPGLYEVEFSAFAEADADLAGSPVETSASYDAFLTWFGSPCSIADVEPPTGVLDLRDISGWVAGYIGAYDIYNPTYDMNRDGLFDLSDIGGFIAAFLAGCDG
jgi:hypothetical protein